MLIKCLISVVKFNAVNINFVDVLLFGVACGHADIARLFEHLVPFVSDALVGLLRMRKKVLDTEFAIVYLHCDIDKETTLKSFFYHTAVVRRGQIVYG